MFWIWACVVNTNDTTEIDTATLEEVISEPDPILELDAQLLPTAVDPCREPVVAWVNHVVDGDTL